MNTKPSQTVVAPPAKKAAPVKAEAPKTLTYVIPDLHGRYDLMLKGLSAITKHAAKNKAAKDIIFLGDYLNRGPDSFQVISLLLKGVRLGWWRALKGNHEEMFYRAVSTKKKSCMEKAVFYAAGGEDTLKHLAKNGVEGDTLLRMATRLNSLPTLITDKRRAYVHGWLPAKSSDKRNLGQSHMWGRFKQMSGKQSANYLFDGLYIVHGHEPVVKAVVQSKRCNLDTRAHQTHRLTIGVFDSALKGKPIKLLRVHASAPTDLAMVESFGVTPSFTVLYHPKKAKTKGGMKGRGDKKKKQRLIIRGELKRLLNKAKKKKDKAPEKKVKKTP
jgi:serine/threonine protein phosphatase 1